MFTTNHRTTFLSYYSLLFLFIHTLARIPYYTCTLVKSDILVAPVHVGTVLFRFDSKMEDPKIELERVSLLQVDFECVC